MQGETRKRNRFLLDAFYLSGTKFWHIQRRANSGGSFCSLPASETLKAAQESLRIAKAICGFRFIVERHGLRKGSIETKGSSLLVGGVFAAAVSTFIFGISTGHLISMALLFCLEIVAAAVAGGDLLGYSIAVITAAMGSYTVYERDLAAEFSLVTFGSEAFSFLGVHVAVCYLSLIYRPLQAFIRPPRNSLLARELADFHEIRQLIFRPYVNVRWSVRRRMRAIINHYTLVENRSPIFALAYDEYIDLATLEVADSVLRVVLARPDWMRREGEIGVSLFWGVDRIYTAMLLLSGTPDAMQLIIGNLQGDGRDRAELYKRLTKALHGLRPRDCLFNVVQMIASELGCRGILGISDQSHRSMHWLSKASKLATYDAIWREHGGVWDDRTSFYQLSATLVKRAAQNIPANKRAMYRRRYELLDNLQLQIRHAIANPIPGIKNGKPKACDSAGKY